MLLRVALLLVGLHCAMALAAPWVAPYGPTEQFIIQRLKGPNALHWLGSDQLGRDLLSRIMHGYRSSLAISLSSVGVALVLGGALGLAAAFYKGWADRIIMRMMDLFFAFPVLLLAIGVVAVLGPGAVSTAAAIAVVYTPIFARLIRGPAMVVAESEYVASARSLGATDLRIILLHILPNLSSVILVQASLLLSAAILVEASLSFLGLGAQPPTASLGLMLAEGRNFLTLSPWSAVFSGAAIVFLAFGFNLLGDTLRDRLDPRLRGNP
jgi:peptide/nickel transport system permease protein